MSVKVHRIQMPEFKSAAVLFVLLLPIWPYHIFPITKPVNVLVGKMATVCRIMYICTSHHGLHICSVLPQLRLVMILIFDW